MEADEVACSRVALALCLVTIVVDALPLYSPLGSVEVVGVLPAAVI